MMKKITTDEKIVRVDDSLKHIAFIMDGNGRWAKKRGLPREAGHKYGALKFQEVIKYCSEIGLKAVTVYAFSTENWKRPENEVKALMKLFESYIDDCISKVAEYNVKIKFIGDMSCFKDSFGEKITRLEEMTAANDLILNVAINYGGRAEITNAVNKLIASGAQSVTENDINNALYTKDSPELDLIVRTGGDLRISNFLLWQTAYAEFYFTDKLWPDLEPDDVDKIVENFTARSRRFGGV